MSHDITVVTLIVLGALVRLYSISLTFSTFLRTSVCLYRTISLVFFTFLRTLVRLYSICLIFSAFLRTLVCLYSICLIFSVFLRTLVRLYSICLIFSTFLRTLVPLYSICPIFSTFLRTLVRLYSICLIFSAFLRTLVRLYSICLIFSTFLCTGYSDALLMYHKASCCYFAIIAILQRSSSSQCRFCSTHAVTFLSLLQRNENSVRATFPLCSLQSFLAAKAGLGERNLFRTGIVALVL